MEPNDQIYQLLKELRDGQLNTSKSLGRLEKGQEDLNSYIGAVSLNTKVLGTQFGEHKDDTEAHGVKAQREAFARVVKGIGGFVAILEGLHFLPEILKFFKQIKIGG